MVGYVNSDAFDFFITADLNSLGVEGVSYAPTSIGGGVSAPPV